MLGAPHGGYGGLSATGGALNWRHADSDLRCVLALHHPLFFPHRVGAQANGHGVLTVKLGCEVFTHLTPCGVLGFRLRGMTGLCATYGAFGPLSCVWLSVAEPTVTMFCL